MEIKELEFTDEEIIKAAECCERDGLQCETCPFYGKSCAKLLPNQVLKLINRQKEEIERLTIERDTLRGAATPTMMRYDAIRAEQAVAESTRVATAREIFAEIDKLAKEGGVIWTNYASAVLNELKNKYTEEKSDAEKV